MFWRKKNEMIDAGVELQHIDGERGGSQLGSQHRKSPAGSKSFLLVILVCAAAIGATFTYKAIQVKKVITTEPVQTTSSVKNTLPEFKPAQPIETPPQTTVSSQPIATNSENSDDTQKIALEQRTAETENLLRQRRLGAALAEENQVQKSNQATQANPQSNVNNGVDTEFQNKLKPLKLNASQAGLIGDRNMLLTQGSMIDCQLETRIVTSQPGMTSCNVTRDIYSTNGRVVLIDRGSKVVGNYQSGLQQGQTRIFVLWSRIETPSGVIINLDSPGTGSLGEAGVGGVIDRHFWERFGSAILFSLIGDFGDWAADQASKGSENSIQFNNTSQGAQQAVTEILKYSMNIPPTLYKNQGDRVSIFVARDLDFGGVYALKPK